MKCPFSYGFPMIFLWFLLIYQRVLNDFRTGNVFSPAPQVVRVRRRPTSAPQAQLQPLRLQGGAPPVITWFIIPLTIVTIDISTINHSEIRVINKLNAIDRGHHLVSFIRNLLSIVIDPSVI